MQLHAYQEYAKDFIIENKKALLLLDMGLGKTLSTLTALNELMVYDDPGKVLVIAPLKVAQYTWSDEIAKWEHLRHMTVSKVLGSKRQREEALKREADIYIINRENTQWLVEHFKGGLSWPFKTVVIDELSSFKSSQSRRWRWLKQVAPKFERFIGLTGTPAPNGLLDLWPQVYLSDQGQRLGKSKTSYTNRYFTPKQQSGYVVYSWALKPGAEAEIYNAVSDITISMKAKDHLKLPGRIDNIVPVRLSDANLALYKRFKRDYVLELPEDDRNDLTALNAASLANKLLQMANGSVYDENGDAVHLHDEKLDALERIVEDAQGQPVLVFYQYKHDLESIKQRFKHAEEFTTPQRWNSGEVPMLLLHPQSAGHGLNLQEGGHIIVWFGLNWSLELYQQANARLDRQGQTETVIVHHLVTQGTIDEQVMASLADKDKTQEALMKAVKAEIGGIR